MNSSISFKDFVSNPPPGNHFMVIGNPVGHSLSPVMHNAAHQFYGYKSTYYAVEMSIDEIGMFVSWMKRESFLGCNITIPYKRVMMELVDMLDPEAKLTGAINTVVKKKNKLIGFNTDVFGFSEPLLKYIDKIDGNSAIVFGTGGAANAVVRALHKLNCSEIVMISRNPEKWQRKDEFKNCIITGYEQWTSYAGEAAIIVNATPLGMKPDINKSPVNDGEEKYLENTICYDLIYRPEKTKFLHQAESAGTITIGGMEMLIYQGSESFRLWTGRPFPIDYVRKQLKLKLAEKETE
ncbi:MAG: shikimate dehydrogenase [Balneolaceae bacterium]